MEDWPSGEFGDNALLLEDIYNTGAEEICTGLIDNADCLIGVATTHSASDWLHTIESLLGEFPPTVKLLVIGNDHDEADRSLDQPVDADTTLEVRTVTSPGNLTRIGVILTEFIDEEEGDESRALCFGELSILDQYATDEQLFQFFHVLTNLIKQHDVAAHYHLNPGAVEDVTTAKLTTSVDTVIDITDGEPTVKRR